MTDNGATSGLSQSSIDDENRRFWDELCGTQLAEHLGITDSGPESLKRFDDWFLDFYCYLDRHIPFAALKGKRVLEVGLGYGTVSQKLAEAGALYTGLDIAAGPVAMVNHRLHQIGLAGEARQGSVLECPFDNESFDFVVAIGCYHHTGDLQRAIDETWRVLVPGGKAIIMLYNAYSYRRWEAEFGSSFRYWIWDKLGIGAAPDTSERARTQYDANRDGEGAPSTLFTSVSRLRRMARRWSRVSWRRENMWTEGYLKYISRETSLRWFSPWCGLDLYFTLQK